MGDPGVPVGQFSDGLLPALLAASVQHLDQIGSFQLHPANAKVLVSDKVHRGLYGRRVLEPLEFDIETTIAEPRLGLDQNHDLSNFGLSDMIECGKVIRSSTDLSLSMVDAAKLLVRYFYQAFRLPDASSDCALVRCFATIRLGALPADLRQRTEASLSDGAIREEVSCLTLLATAGDLPAWNDPAASTGHAVIPLENVESVSRAPMISQLIRQLGLDINMVIAPDSDLFLEADGRSYGVFHVEEALGSESIPAQDFVVQHGITSVLGFGGLFPSGELFAIILFSKVRITREGANLFRTLALSVKLALLPFAWGPIFEGEPGLSREVKRSPEQDRARSEIATLRLLIPALEAAALYQTSQLQDVIADLHQQKEQFRKLGSRLSSMLESTTDAVFMLDRAWRFTYLNHHAVNMLQTGSSLLGENIWERFPDANESSFRHHYHMVMEERTAVQFQEHYPAPLDRWFEVHAFPSDEGIAVFFHDITERRQAETALLKNEKLAAVGRLSASIAHEINNPLESVTNLLYLARTSTEPAVVQEYLSTADRELRRVGAITSQTLRFHKQSSHPISVTCEELIEGVLSIYHGRIVNSRVHVEQRQRADRPVLCFDGEIRQVLNNLVGNTIDALHPDGGRLLLRGRHATDWRTGRQGLAITVADTGPGMSPHTRQKATEPFFTTKGIGGTGLGLWISQEIVERHEGRLSLRSSQMTCHTGTVITVFLPFDAASR